MGNLNNTLNSGLWPGPPLMHSINPHPVSYRPTTATASAISPQDMVPKPFKLKFLTNQIKVCADCKQGYQRRTDPPYDICIVHEESIWIVQHDMPFKKSTNAHYHGNATCITIKHPAFQPNCVEIPPDVKVRLLPVHKHYLRDHFGIII